VNPPGARVYINGAPRGTTPMTVRLDLGQYQVRLSRPGYQEVERQVTLEKMKEYPLSETLKPE
jgi:eukaryotic-like serine/threonine-protein kinase